MIVTTLAKCEPPRPAKGQKVKRVFWLRGQRSRVRGQYYVDKSCRDKRLIKLLRRHAHLNIRTSDGDGTRGLSHENIMVFAARNRWVIITSDIEFLRLHNGGHAHSGIIHAPRGSMWFQEIVRKALYLAMEEDGE